MGITNERGGRDLKDWRKEKKRKEKKRKEKKENIFTELFHLASSMTWRIVSILAFNNADYLDIAAVCIGDELNDMVQGMDTNGASSRKITEVGVNDP